MRRKLPLFVMVGVAGVLVPVLAVLAQSSSTTYPSGCCSQESCPASNSSAPSATDGKIIDELIVILKETKSTETFAVTAMALGRMGPEAKRALPQLIRNAERLEVIVGQVAEAIVMLAESNKDGRPARYAYPMPSPSYSNGPYDTPGVAGGWDQPQPAGAPPAVAPYPTTAAPCPITSAPVPGTASTPVYVPNPGATQPTPLPAVKKASPKGGKSRPPVAPTPYTAR